MEELLVFTAKKVSEASAYGCFAHHFYALVISVLQKGHTREMRCILQPVLE